ncbi:copper chaperone [Paraoerskovia sediminicola]|nr:copper chaperone [Paraoerskovia sediminicola]
MTTVTKLDVHDVTGSDGVARIQSTLKATDGVGDVIVEIRGGGTARVTVLSHDSLDAEDLARVLRDARFDVDGTSTTADAVAAEAAEQSGARQAAHDEAAHTS